MEIKGAWQGEKLVKLEKGKEISEKRKISREWGQRGEEKMGKGKKEEGK
jgi:hypothetical protein